MSSLNLQNPEGLKFFRLIMVLCSLSPLFILWVIRGNRLIEDRWFIPGCLLFAGIPNLWFYYRLKVAQKRRDIRSLTIAKFEDYRPQLIAYLFTILLPFYRQEFGTLRDIVATSAALLMIIFLFYKLNIHNVNPILLIFGYRIYTVGPMSDDNPYSGKASHILITWRRDLNENDQIAAIRLSRTVYLERKLKGTKEERK